MLIGVWGFVVAEMRASELMPVWCGGAAYKGLAQGGGAATPLSAAPA